MDSTATDDYIFNTDSLLPLNFTDEEELDEDHHHPALPAGLLQTITRNSNDSEDDQSSSLNAKEVTSGVGLLSAGSRVYSPTPPNTHTSNNNTKSKNNNWTSNNEPKAQDFDITSFSRLGINDQQYNTSSAQNNQSTYNDYSNDYNGNSYADNSNTYLPQDNSNRSKLTASGLMPGQLNRASSTPQYQEFIPSSLRLQNSSNHHNDNSSSNEWEQQHDEHNNNNINSNSHISSNNLNSNNNNSNNNDETEDHPNDDESEYDEGYAIYQAQQSQIQMLSHQISLQYPHLNQMQQTQLLQQQIPNLPQVQIPRYNNRSNQSMQQQQPQVMGYDQRGNPQYGYPANLNRSVSAPLGGRGGGDDYYVDSRSSNTGNIGYASNQSGGMQAQGGYSYQGEDGRVVHARGDDDYQQQQQQQQQQQYYEGRTSPTDNHGSPTSLFSKNNRASPPPSSFTSSNKSLTTSTLRHPQLLHHSSTGGGVGGVYQNGGGGQQQQQQQAVVGLDGRIILTQNNNNTQYDPRGQYDPRTGSMIDSRLMSTSRSDIYAHHLTSSNSTGSLSLIGDGRRGGMLNEPSLSLSSDLRGGALNAGVGASSTLLEEFKRESKSRALEWRIKDIRNHIVEFCRDQQGSRFVQQRVELSPPSDDVQGGYPGAPQVNSERQLVLNEILGVATTLCNDVFGNYVIQKLFEFGSTSMRNSLGLIVTSEGVHLSTAMYGCRVVQKALQFLEGQMLERLMDKFHGEVERLIHDQNGNHVIQKCIEVICALSLRNPQASRLIDFIVNAVLSNLGTLACHGYGCRVVQRMLEHCLGEQKLKTLGCIHVNISVLIDDQFGNYVIQHVLQYGRPSDRETILKLVLDRGVLNVSRQKFASNVVEKILVFGERHLRTRLIEEMLTVRGNGSLLAASSGYGGPTYGGLNGVGELGGGIGISDGVGGVSVVGTTTTSTGPSSGSGSSGIHDLILLSMVRDAFANYVVQKALEVAEGNQRTRLIESLRGHLVELRQFTYAKHIITKIEKE